MEEPRARLAFNLPGCRFVGKPDMGGLVPTWEVSALIGTYQMIESGNAMIARWFTDESSCSFCSPICSSCRPLRVRHSVNFGGHADVKSSEQTSFAMESIPLSHPINLPNDALRVMRKNETVLSCSEQEQSGGEALEKWFVASEIHMTTNSQVDLVVMPRDMREKPSANRCLYNAHSMPFWILAKQGSEYTIVLEDNVQTLKVLRTMSHEYRDIETSSSNLNASTKWLYQFDGHIYTLSKKTSTPR